MTNPFPSKEEPQSPFRPLPGEGRRPPVMIDPNEPLPPAPARGGCGLMGIFGGLIVAFALVIVALAGAAGWTAGQRDANVNALATQNFMVSEQLERIPVDAAACNTVLLQTRVDYLVALGVPEGSEIVPTATALYFTCQPTATLTPTTQPTATLTLDVLSADAAMTDDPAPIFTPSAGGYDLAAILQQAQTTFDTGNYDDAIEYIDVVIGIDETFQTVQVRQLASRALNARARELYNANQPATANLLVDRARQYGALEDGLEYESYAATLYLNGRAAVGTGYAQAIQSLRQVVDLGAGGRYYADALNLLMQQYIAYGDAWAAEGQYCPAEQQYRNAASLGGAVGGRLTTAANICANGTPTPDPLLGVPPAAPGSDPGFAPLGGG